MDMHDDCNCLGVRAERQNAQQPLRPLGRLRMYAGHQLCMLGILLVVLQQKLSSLFIQR